MNKYGVSVTLKVVPIDKQARESQKATAKLYEEYLEWETETVLQEFMARHKEKPTDPSGI